MIKLPISALANILFACAFSTFKILPLKGRIACVSLSLPCFAEPPAESPSTMYNSHFSASLEAQSASFPGKEVISKEVFLLVDSLAAFAARRALAARVTFSIINLATLGFSFKNLSNVAAKKEDTILLTSELPSLPLV